MKLRDFFHTNDLVMLTKQSHVDSCWCSIVQQIFGLTSSEYERTLSNKQSAYSQNELFCFV